MTADADRILDAVRAIPPGQVASYGEIARRAGLPRRARLVARVLARNGDAGVPWHRVIRADGRIAFDKGSDEYLEQCTRLRAEGVCVERGRAAPGRVRRSLDEQVWGGRD